MIDEAVRSELEHGQLIDITTIGRRSGRARRLEITFHNVGGHLYISGSPSPKRRSWIANLAANPNFTFHLKRRIKADLPAMARIIDEESERRSILPHIARRWGVKDVERMIRQSPLIEVTIHATAS